MKKKGMLLLAVVIAAGVGVGYRIRSDRMAESAKAGHAMPPLPVTVARAVTRDMPLLLDMVGRAEAYESVTLKSRVDGQVAAVPYREGQHVREGEVLVRLDPADFNARVLQAQANVARDQAQLAKAHADVERYRALKERGFVSDEMLSTMRTTEASAAATMRADQAALELARLQLGYATIRAPFAGIVGAKLVFPGTGVKTNDTSLAVVNRVRPLYVSFTVPEKQLPQLRAAMGEGALKVVVSVPGDGGQRFEGEAHFLDNAVDPATGTIQMKAVVANREEKLTPGQYLNVSLALGMVNNAVVVPTQAVQEGPEGNFVYVVKADGRAEPRKIELSFTRDGSAVIARGLEGGETVVTDGQLRLTPGAKVRAREPGKTAVHPSPQAGR